MGQALGHSEKPGVKTKLLGVIILIVAALGSMLSWRGGLVVTNFYLVLFATGVLLYIVGSVRQTSATKSKDPGQDKEDEDCA